VQYAELRGSSNINSNSSNSSDEDNNGDGDDQSDDDEVDDTEDTSTKLQRHVEQFGCLLNIMDRVKGKSSLSFFQQETPVFISSIHTLLIFSWYVFFLSASRFFLIFLDFYFNRRTIICTTCSGWFLECERCHVHTRYIHTNTESIARG
jgi:hypothetical protein